MSEKEPSPEQKQQETKERIHAWVDQVIDDPTSDIEMIMLDILSQLIHVREEQERQLARPRLSIVEAPTEEPES